jgi:small subunit ribosomal protein S9
MPRKKKEENLKEAKKAKKEKPKKTEKPKKVLVEPEIEPSFKSTRYWEATGRRKTAVARVRLLTKGGGEILVNEKPYQKYFPTLELWQIATASLQKMKSLERFQVSAKIKGGGIHAQAEALSHGISRALVKFNPDFRKRLKKSGFLTRDSRMRERKKFGLKRARRAPQWAKR